MHRLALILGDQLTHGVGVLADADPAKTTVLMAEVAEEAGYVRHHRKKIALIFAAMRHFAAELRERGWTVRHVALDDPGNTGSLGGEVARALGDTGAGSVAVMEPGEHRLASDMAGWADRLGVPVAILPDTRFLASHADFDAWAEGRKSLRMEYFYREMRRRTGLLMEGDKPAGGKWNFDAENRKPADRDLFMPAPPRFEVDGVTRAVLDLVDARFPDHPGDLEPFWYGVTRDHALAALDHFIAHALPRFGDYQDAMLAGAPFLYHSVLSIYLNIGLLDPLEICQRAEAAWRAGDAPINAVEGFVRQIIGWREYVRGIYWREGPDYTARNHLGATRALPGYYWSGETDMACMKAAIGQTMEHAYAHHIQRLMVTGTFALLAGVDPAEVHEWYLAVYADAFEWVEAPNVIGMSQFADGGILASKPYAASGSYIAKMSDYCGGCAYNVKDKTGQNACPFNPLYWDFLVRNRSVLGRNARLGPVYRTWDRMDADKQEAYRAAAERVLARVEDL